MTVVALAHRIETDPEPLHLQFTLRRQGEPPPRRGAHRGQRLPLRVVGIFVDNAGKIQFSSAITLSERITRAEQIPSRLIPSDVTCRCGRSML
jgi:hypothetical protein